MMLYIKDDETKLTGKIEFTLDLIIKYYFFKHYHKDYCILNYYLEDNAKEFVKDIEYKYWHNQIDEYALTHSYDFTDFLLERCHDDIKWPEEEKSYFDEITQEEYVMLSNYYDELYNINIDDEVE